MISRLVVFPITILTVGYTYSFHPDIIRFGRAKKWTTVCNTKDVTYIREIIVRWAIFLSCILEMQIERPPYMLQNRVFPCMWQIISLLWYLATRWRLYLYFQVDPYNFPKHPKDTSDAISLCSYYSYTKNKRIHLCFNYFFLTMFPSPDYLTYYFLKFVCFYNIRPQ